MYSLVEVPDLVLFWLFLTTLCSDQQVFKTFDVVGWYCVNSTPPGKREERLIDQLLCVCESPILLQFDPESLASKVGVSAVAGTTFLCALLSCPWS